MSQPAGRALPNARMRRFLLAVQDVMGRSGLTTILRQAGLPHYAGDLPPHDHATRMTASEYAALSQAIENYYGRGARGTLIRIGHAAFQQFLASRRGQAQLYQMLFLVLPLQMRKSMALGWLARQMAEPGGQVTVHHDDRRLTLVDHEADACYGRARESEICWESLGEIQAALVWATGRHYDVTETACRAKGEPACRFEVGQALMADTD